MQEIKALLPGDGNERIAEVAMLFNLYMVYTLSDQDGMPDSVEAALLAEAAVAMTPSPSTWKEVPLYFHAHTIERLRDMLSEVGIVFVLDDHGNRGAKL
eukprot:SAG31_NODE_2404_length_5763_cov_6.902560_2_plen_99_part_00